MTLTAAEADHRTRPQPESTSHWGLSIAMIALVLLPLGFGGNRDVPLYLYQIALASGALLTLWRAARAPHQMPVMPWLLAGALVLFGAVLIWSWLQTRSWMPAPWHHPLWQDAGRVLGAGADVESRITMDPEAAWHGWLRLASALLTGLVVWSCCRDPVTARRVLNILLAAITAYAAYGLVMYGFGIEKILFYDKTSYFGQLTSTFVNKNHFATYAGLGVIIAAGMLWQGLRHAMGRDAYEINADALATYLTHRGLYYVLATAVLILALLAASSRAGFACTLAGIAGLFASLFVYQGRRQRRMGIGTGLFVLAGALVLLFILGSPLLERYARLFQDDSSIERWRVWQMTLIAIADSPWLGYGLGNFEALLRFYRDDSVRGWFHRAHNDWLEMICELGIPGALALFSACALLVCALVRGILYRHRDGFFAAIGIGASVLVFSHALVDFPLQIPAVAATYAAVMGCALAQCWSPRTDPHATAS